MSDDIGSSTRTATGEGKEKVLDVVGQILKHRSFRKRRIYTTLKLYKKVFFEDLKYSATVAVALFLIFLLLISLGIVELAQLKLMIIACVTAVIIYPACVLPWASIFRNRLWYRDAIGMESNAQGKLMELAAYVQRSRSVDILNVVNLSKKGEGSGRVGSAKDVPNTRAAVAELVELRKNIEKLDHSIEMYELYPLEHKNSHKNTRIALTENNSKKRQTYITRPVSFVTAYSIGIGLLVLGGFGVIILTAFYVDQTRMNAPVKEMRTTIYAFFIMAAFVCIGIFSTVANLWEQVAWKKFSTSKIEHGRYFDATKELRDYTVTLCYGVLAVAFIYIVIFFAQRIAPDDYRDDLNFPGLGQLVLSVFVILTLNSAGKLLGSGRSSLDKALLVKSN